MIIKFLKIFSLFFLCYALVFLVKGETISIGIMLKTLGYSFLIASGYLFVTSRWWKKHVLKLKDE